MKKFVLLGTILFVLGLKSARAQQETSESEFSQRLLDYDYSLTVKCSYNEITKYISPNCHEKPVTVNGMITFYGGGRGKNRHYHKCEKDSLPQAQEIYLSRLKKINSPTIFRHPLSREAEKIVRNFELLTGTYNMEGIDSYGRYYISDIARTAWRSWYNNNKGRLHYCEESGILYVNKSIVNR